MAIVRGVIPGTRMWVVRRAFAPTPMQAIQFATSVGAKLLGGPRGDIPALARVKFVIKGGAVYKQ